MRSEKFTFTGHGGDALAARLDLPGANSFPGGNPGASANPAAGVVFAHCFTCTKDIAAVRRISSHLTAQGFAVLSFDFTGLGHSMGEFANTHFSSNVEDLVRAAAALDERGIAPQILIGHSLGGAAVLAAAPRIPGARAVVTIAAPHDPAHVLHNFAADIDEIRSKGEAVVKLAGRPFTIRRTFLDDIAGNRLDGALAEMKQALLILHAPTDQTVGIENAAAIYGAARHPKSFVTLDKADHLLTRAADAEYAASLIAVWSARYLEKSARPDAVEDSLRVVGSAADGLRHDITAGRHHIVADEPVAAGGTDQGMTPYQLLAAALGTCTAITLRLYARRKNWLLADVSVEVRHEKRHREDCDGCEGGGSRIDRFERIIHLTGELDDDARKRLLEIAGKCPVHRTLESHSEIVTRLG